MEISNVFEAFGGISKLARELNVQLENPELVFIGKQGSGKSSLINSILGFPLLLVGEASGGVTKRPVQIHVINNPHCESPKVTLKRDMVLQNKPTDLTLFGEDLEEELQERNVISMIPIVIHVELKNIWNMTLIDTPGIQSPTAQNSEISAEEIEEMILDLTKSTHRMIIFVEKMSGKTTANELLNESKKFNVALDRTTFVYTHLLDHIQFHSSERDLVRSLNNLSSVNGSCFFVSLIEASEGSHSKSASAYKQKLIELETTGSEELEKLQIGQRYKSLIGNTNFKHHLLQLTWKKHQQNIPELLKVFRAKQVQSETQLKKIEKDVETLNPSELRRIASQYVMKFLQNIEKLLTGTLDGNPIIYGQTLDEEKHSDETGEWCDHTRNIIEYDQEKVPKAKLKLYGGQQFERLLSEFEVIIEMEKIGEITVDEIASAAGPNNLKNATCYTWAASDIASKRLSKKLMPIIEQLFVRTVYILKKMTLIVQTMMTSGVKDKNNKNGYDSLPMISKNQFLVQDVNSVYNEFIDKLITRCKNKCFEEFYGTRLINWELTNTEKSIDTKIRPGDDIIANIQKLASEIYQVSKQRIVRNVLLKCYDNLFVPLETELWEELQGHITSLSDSALEEMFDIKNTKERLLTRKSDMEHILNHFKKKETWFSEQVRTFENCKVDEINF